VRRIVQRFLCDAGVAAVDVKAALTAVPGASGNVGMGSVGVALLAQGAVLHTSLCAEELQDVYRALLVWRASVVASSWLACWLAGWLAG
jgi:hypothetical protein